MQCMVRLFKIHDTIFFKHTHTHTHCSEDIESMKLKSLRQSDHCVSGELRAAYEPDDREERLPGERAGREGVASGVCAKIKG